MNKIYNLINEIKKNWIIILGSVMLAIGVIDLIITSEIEKKVINEEQKNYIIEQAKSGEKIIKVGGEIEEVLLCENGILEFKKEEKGGSVWKVIKNKPDNIVVKMVDDKGEIVNDEGEVRNINNIGKKALIDIIVGFVGFVLFLIGLSKSDCDKKQEEEVSESVAE